MVSSVVVRWIDLGTKLILRHVVRVLGAEQEEHGGRNNNQNENESDIDGDETAREKSHRGEGEGADWRAKAGAATAEVDLDEARWAECTGREKERKLSKSNARKLAGKWPSTDSHSECSKSVHRVVPHRQRPTGWRSGCLEPPPAMLCCFFRFHVWPACFVFAV